MTTTIWPDYEKNLKEFAKQFIVDEDEIRFLIEEIRYCSQCGKKIIFRQIQDQRAILNIMIIKFHKHPFCRDCGFLQDIANDPPIIIKGI